jgi:hypothetical protein
VSNLTYVEKRKFEQLLGMSSGYVLDFSNRTFAEFVRDSTGRDIYDSSYDYASGSKANRLRAFWQKEPNPVVGKLMGDMLDYVEGNGELKEVCRLIAARLVQETPVGHTGNNLEHREEQSQVRRRSQALGQLKEEFLRLAMQSDRNRAGLALEQLLAGTRKPPGKGCVYRALVDSFHLEGNGKGLMILPGRTSNLDPPYRAALIERAFQFDECRRIPLQNPNANILGLLSDQRS